MLSFIYLLKCIPKNLFLFVDRELWYIINSACREFYIFWDYHILFLHWPVDILNYFIFKVEAGLYPRRNIPWLWYFMVPPGGNAVSTWKECVFCSSWATGSTSANKINSVDGVAQVFCILLIACLLVLWILYFYLHRIPWSDTEHILLLWVPSVHQSFQLL